MDENDVLDDTIVPDPDDPGEEFTLPEVVSFADDPVDPDAEDSPDVEAIDAADPDGVEATDE